MKISRLLPVIVGFLAATPLLLTAQDTSTSAERPASREKGEGRGRGPGPMGRGQLMNPEARVADLDRRVGGLTEDQKTKLTEIYTKAQEEMQSLRGTGERRGNRDEMMSLMERTREQVQGVLTDEQRQKFGEMGAGKMGQGKRGGPRGGKGDRPGRGPGGGKRGKGRGN